jgi:hypothetical protein
MTYGQQSPPPRRGKKALGPERVFNKEVQKITFAAKHMADFQ